MSILINKRVLFALFSLSFFLTLFLLSKPTLTSTSLLSGPPEIFTVPLTYITESAKSETALSEPKNVSYKAAPRNSILIYHTHNRESWLPELKTAKAADQAFDSKINVTLLGSRLMDELVNKGLNAIHSKTDYPTQSSNFNYALSYKYSKKTVLEETRRHGNIKYIFDIHRDSADRDKTTITFRGQNYAQVYFVVGTNNPKWRKNMQFAEKLHAQLNSLVPSISKGIYEKDKSSGNGEYNQSISEFSALIEVGGVGNTLEESNATIDILADVIKQLWEEEEGPSVLASAL